MEIAISLVIGAAAGILGGLFGIGGGVLIIPALVFILGFTQQKAQGTSLVALLAPVGILAVMNYAKAAQIDWKVGILIAAGFVGGAYFGSRFALTLDETLLRKLFAGFLVLVAIQIYFKK